MSIANVNHNTYHVSFYGQTIITIEDIDSSTVSNWISEVLKINSHCLRTLIVGLDAEWGYSAAYQLNSVSTVQICIGHWCLIYQIKHSIGDIPQSLVNFLCSPDFSFVGVGVADDQKNIFSQFGIVCGERAVDLMFLAVMKYSKPELRQTGLKYLARLVMECDFEKSKSMAVSNWANRRLTDEQVKYACLDAYVSY